MSSSLEGYASSFIVFLGKIFISYQNDDKLHGHLKGYLCIKNSSVDADIIKLFREKALIQMVLLTTAPNTLGQWSILDGGGLVATSTDKEEGSNRVEEVHDEGDVGHLIEQPGSVFHLLYLISSGSTPSNTSPLPVNDTASNPNYYYNQYIAAEVICLASSEPACHAVLGPLVSSSMMTTLLHHSPFISTRAAAASTLTKLGLKSSALKESSEEISNYLNVITDILKMNCTKSMDDSSDSNNSNSSGDGSDKSQGLKSFSVFDNIAISASTSNAANCNTGDGGVSSSRGKMHGGALSSSSSLERAVEMLAALSGKTFIKEELTHGSYR